MCVQMCAAYERVYLYEDAHFIYELNLRIGATYFLIQIYILYILLVSCHCTVWTFSIAWYYFTHTMFSPSLNFYAHVYVRNKCFHLNEKQKRKKLEE